MNDDEFLRRFEDGSLAGAGFHHRDHVRVVWLYLQRLPLWETLGRLSRGLAGMAARQGRPELYHETITWAYAVLINERWERSGREANWERFLAQNADLLSWRPGALGQYYPGDVLASDLARRVFVLPSAACTARPHPSDRRS